MATYTSSGSGNWNLSSTWGGIGVPGNGDQAIIAAGHTVDVTDDQIVGTSPAGTDTTTYAVDINATGRLNITGSSARLRVRGPCRTNNTASQTTNLIALAITAGGRLSFDGTQAATPSTATYRWTWGNANWCYRYILFSGPSIIDSETGAGNGYFVASNNGLGIDASGYCIIRRIGDATNRAFTQAYQDSTNMRFRLQDVWFDTTGGVGQSSTIGANVNWLVQRVTFTNTAHTQSWRQQGGGAAKALEDLVCDKQVQLDSSDSLLTRPVFLGGFTRTGTFTSSVANDGFVHATANGTPQLARTSNREYRSVQRTGSISKPFQVAASTNADTVDLVLEPIETVNSDGEYFAGTTGNGTHTNPICLPSHAGTGGNGWRLIEILNDTTSIQTVINGTVASYQASVGFGHAGHTTANNGVERARVRNTFWFNVAQSGIGATNSSKVALIPSGTTPTGNYVGTEFTNNGSGGTLGGANLITGSQGKGYDVAPSSGTPGAGDVDNVDPLFNGAPGGGLGRLHTFARDVLGLGGTIASREDAVLAALNVQQLTAGRYDLVSDHANYLSGVSNTAIHTWVRDKCRPKNVLLKTNAVPANSGGWIGAMEGIAPSVTDFDGSVAAGCDYDDDGYFDMRPGSMIAGPRPVTVRVSRR